MLKIDRPIHSSITSQVEDLHQFCPELSRQLWLERSVARQTSLRHLRKCGLWSGPMQETTGPELMGVMFMRHNAWRQRCIATTPAHFQLQGLPYGAAANYRDGSAVAWLAARHIENSDAWTELPPENVNPHVASCRLRQATRGQAVGRARRLTSPINRGRRSTFKLPPYSCDGKRCLHTWVREATVAARICWRSRQTKQG